MIPRLLICGVLALGLTACGNNTPSASQGKPEGVSLQAYDYRFEPTALELTAGASVTLTFENKGGTAHSFTVDSLGIDTVAQPGETKTVTFTAPDSGSISFHCHFHPDQMQGTMSVGGTGASPAGSPTSGTNSSPTSSSGYNY